MITSNQSEESNWIQKDSDNLLPEGASITANHDGASTASPDGASPEGEIRTSSE